MFYKKSKTLWHSIKNIQVNRKAYLWFYTCCMSVNILQLFFGNPWMIFANFLMAPAMYTIWKNKAQTLSLF